ncbi:MAG: chromosome partitioning protein ParA, partial [Rhodospirillales bacterium]|nr:chromosome partitioning protein ParA [Rhodospirillales bacterium]
EKAARIATNEADAAHARARDRLAEIRQRAAEIDSRLGALAETAERIEADRAEAAERLRENRETLDGLPDPTAERERLVALRADVGERRSHQVACQSALDSVLREARERQARRDAIARDLASWHSRGEAARLHLEELAARRKSVEEEAARLAERPAEIASQRQTLLGLIEASEGKRNAAADRLAEAEGCLSAADRDLREAEAALAKAREDRVRAEGAVEQGRLAVQALTERVRERLDCLPQALTEVAELGEEEELPDLEATEKRVDRLLRERETMGPVNLRAEQEASELDEQITTLQQERGDLIKAIEKLRRGISDLNREGRQRLVASFEEVDGHFRALFTRLFGGGRAHLALTESDDPLDAGLEIMASPPGKRLQVLSLLSGGEQALTALALMFAVFLTNPAPVCVLDEVDAPLDDANVDRFCTLVSELGLAGHTRFLVITHHRMTMARMDRLFGVTMAERGVSQLVSVDLQQAVALREIA